jgi:hypothetical protein
LNTASIGQTAFRNTKPETRYENPLKIIDRGGLIIHQWIPHGGYGVSGGAETMKRVEPT